MVQLIPASEIRTRHIIRVHNESVVVLGAATQDGTTRIRFAARHGDDSIVVKSTSLVPRHETP